MTTPNPPLAVEYAVPVDEADAARLRTQFCTGVRLLAHLILAARRGEAVPPRLTPYPTPASPSPAPIDPTPAASLAPLSARGEGPGVRSA